MPYRTTTTNIPKTLPTPAPKPLISSHTPHLRSHDFRLRSVPRSPARLACYIRPAVPSYQVFDFSHFWCQSILAQAPLIPHRNVFYVSSSSRTLWPRYTMPRCHIRCPSGNPDPLSSSSCIRKRFVLRTLTCQAAFSGATLQKVALQAHTVLRICLRRNSLGHHRCRKPLGPPVRQTARTRGAFFMSSLNAFWGWWCVRTPLLRKGFGKPLHADC